MSLCRARSRTVAVSTEPTQCQHETSGGAAPRSACVLTECRFVDLVLQPGSAVFSLTGHRRQLSDHVRRCRRSDAAKIALASSWYKRAAPWP